MCGIICIVSSQNSSTNLLEIFENFKQNLLRRGPDSLNFEKYRSENYDILFAATVLWLQGKCITVQPLYDDNSVFIYNGDVFGGISDDSRREFGDTKIIFELLRDTKSIPKTLSKLHGPYAFVYFDKQNQKLYFGRDLLPVWQKRTSEYDFIELPSIGTFCLDLETDKMFVVPWEYQNQNFASKLAEVKSFLNRDIFIMDELGSKGQITFLEPNIEQLYLLSQIKRCSN
ncbi:hypothetical protein NQ318_014904 [Aromia moschata]|uniref:Glutamine amidotransferase type-2 domain-containing protein n=1 Tax=Aromia moschata TaxID=1265417 RepID=A0AAV8YTJ2_9CUCU|nr:hypothetical protein NQ318_014904 [Aromia moschata]